VIKKKRHQDGNGTGHEVHLMGRSMSNSSANNTYLFGGSIQRKQRRLLPAPLFNFKILNLSYMKRSLCPSECLLKHWNSEMRKEGELVAACDRCSRCCGGSGCWASLAEAEQWWQQ